MYIFWGVQHFLDKLNYDYRIAFVSERYNANVQVAEKLIRSEGLTQCIYTSREK